MKIAQVSPLIESVPPKTYGGTERIVSYLTEGLIKKGHDVTLFASADSKTKGRLIATTEKGLRLNNQLSDTYIYHTLQLADVLNYSNEFDIIHFHTDFLHFPVSRISNYSHVTTLHGALDLNGLNKLYEEYSDIPLVSISDSQRKPIGNANWVRTVYHGLPADLYSPNYKQGKYLAFIGRISPEKGLDKAIQIAIKSGIPLKISAKVDRFDVDYYESVILPMLKHPLIEYVGEIDDKSKIDFLGNAIAMLFPIAWSEPFGLVLIEAMACATPVIAFDRGSVPEIISDGVNGYVVNTIDEAVEAVKRISRIKRKICRSYFEEKFTDDVMVANYLDVYQSVKKLSNTDPNKIEFTRI
jgi:glycosyltransferase involved in cell wall biosynthesis